MHETLLTLILLTLAWVVFYLAAVVLRLDRRGLEIHPLYALYKSTRLNAFIERMGRLSPRLWRTLGNIGVAASFLEASFMIYVLALNLYRFIFRPELAVQVEPLIPGLTIRLESLPWFLAAAGFVILLHELSHGVQCAVEGVPIKSSAILLAVFTFGGAVEPDEGAMEAAGMMSKMRIFAAGSLTNLATGVILYLVFMFFAPLLPIQLLIFLWWVYFLSVNVALINMLPLYPLDGGQMMRAYADSLRQGGKILQNIAMYGSLLLIVSNLVLSLLKFGLTPLPF